MKVILLLSLMNLFYSFVISLKKYDKTSTLEYSGVVALDVSDFEEGDSIYISVNSYFDKYYNYINYTFSNIYPEDSD